MANENIDNRHKAALTVIEEFRKENETAAKRINEAFAENKERLEALRETFGSIDRITAPALESWNYYQDSLKKSVAIMQPFRQMLIDNESHINKALKSLDISNFENILPIIKDVEKSVKLTSQFYNQKGDTIVTSKLYPRAIRNQEENEVIAELKELGKQMDKLITAKVQSEKNAQMMNNINASKQKNETAKKEKHTLNLGGFTEINLIRVKRVLTVIANELELQGLKVLIGNSISLRLLEREGILFEEAETILSKIRNVSVLNRQLNEMFEKYGSPIVPPIIPQKEVEENLIILVDDINDLREIAKEADEKLKRIGAGNDTKEKRDIKIKKITIIRMNDGGYFFAVNDDYDELRPIKNNGKYWPIFIDEIDKRDVKPETRQNVKVISKEMVDYFNYNSRCPVYMGGKYVLTDIFTGKGIDTIISPEIKTKLITERQYSIIRGRKRKKTT